MTSRTWVSVSSADHSPSRGGRANRSGGAVSTARRMTPADDRIRSMMARCSGLIVSVGDSADHAAWVARREDVVGDVTRHHAAGPYHRARADTSAGKNQRSAAHPDVG